MNNTSDWSPLANNLGDLHKMSSMSNAAIDKLPSSSLEYRVSRVRAVILRLGDSLEKENPFHPYGLTNESLIQGFNQFGGNFMK